MTENQSQSHESNDPWEDLPDDWDQDNYQKALLTLEEITTKAAMHAPEALQFLIDLARGRIKDADGNDIDVHDVHERLLAAQTILEIAGVIPDLPRFNGRDTLIKSLFSK